MSKVNSILVPSGKFVTVTFVTNKGETRKINGRTGVRKYSKGKPATVPNDKYFTIYTRNGSKAFDAIRSINKNTIVDIKAEGIAVSKNKNSVYAKAV